MRLSEAVKEQPTRKVVALATALILCLVGTAVVLKSGVRVQATDYIAGEAEHSQDKAQLREDAVMVGAVVQWSGYEYAAYQGAIESEHAEDACVSDFGGHLVSFHSDEEYEFFKQLQASIQNIGDQSYDLVWIGMHETNGVHYPAAGYAFEWTDGTPFDYLPAGEPQEASSGDHYCFAYSRTSLNQYIDQIVDVSCNYNDGGAAAAQLVDGYVCKRGGSPPAPSTLMVVPGSVSFSGAEALCAAHGGTLAYLNDQAARDEAHVLAENRGHYWLAAAKAGDSWAWTGSGSPSFDASPTGANVIRNEPGDCGVFFAERAGQLNGFESVLCDQVFDGAVCFV